MFKNEESLPTAHSATAPRIDADSHIMEPPDLWDRYLEEKFRTDRPLRVVRTNEGWETLLIDGKLSRNLRSDSLLLINGMGKTREEVLAGSYSENPEFGARDPKERMQFLNDSGLDAQIIFPSLGLLWNAEVEDMELATAYARAYNRWIVDFCSESDGRLVPMATVIPDDPKLAVEEMTRAVEDGCKGVWMPHALVTYRSHANPDFDDLWAAAQDLDVTVSIHPTIEPPPMRVHQRFHDMQRWPVFHFYACGHQASQQVLSAIFQWGLFDRFPRIRIAMIETAAGWLSHFVSRMDAIAATSLGESLRLKDGKPSDYFKKHVFVAADPDEPIDGVVDLFGSGNLMWGSDYPHFDHADTWSADIDRSLENLTEQDRDNILGLNAQRIWKLDLPPRS